MFAYKSIECLYQLLKCRHLIVRYISLYPHVCPHVVFLNFSGNLESYKIQEKKENNSIVLA